MLDPTDVIMAAIRAAFVSTPRKAIRIGEASTGSCPRNAPRNHKLWRSRDAASTGASSGEVGRRRPDVLLCRGRRRAEQDGIVDDKAKFRLALAHVALLPDIRILRL
jgi:hypothetical protein